MKQVGLVLAALALAGCASWGYRWTSPVPEKMRSVSVPNFENRTRHPELGPIVAQYTLREFEREGTFKIRRPGDAAVEVQGAIVSATDSGISYERTYTDRAHEYRYEVEASVSAIDKRTGRTLFENRSFKGSTTFVISGEDRLTGRRNAAFRVAQDIARQIVDVITRFDYAAKPGATSEAK